MAGGFRALRWRLASGLVAVGLVWIWVVASGRTSHIVQVDYSWGGDFLDGAEVEIDGAVVGVLQRYGRSGYTTGFEVEPGDHTIRILREGCDATPRTFRLGGDDGRLASFMADVDDGARCRVLLR